MADVKYRIVPDTTFIHEWNIQKKVWWFPFWIPVTTIGYSKDHCLRRIKYLQQLPEVIVCE